MGCETWYFSIENNFSNVSPETFYCWSTFSKLSFCRKALLFRRHFVQKKVTCLTQHVSFEKSTCIILLHKITMPLQLEICHLLKYIIKKTVSSSKYLKYSRKTNSGKLLQGKSLINLRKNCLYRTCYCKSIKYNMHYDMIKASFWKKYFSSNIKQFTVFLLWIVALKTPRCNWEIHMDWENV